MRAASWRAGVTEIESVSLYIRLAPSNANLNRSYLNKQIFDIFVYKFFIFVLISLEKYFMYIAMNFSFFNTVNVF